ncbi:hypothetical protein KUCAC02_025805 [Chaenocephalus aceratus]|uniref:Uncharacterized protein n=1 Tax=Chaenocephalus aceratus TaxID=36190 RepID=A0ACB9VUX2_CHAAC|nr:hypothetical protein KUCAC02_025805 [Chaenocephalus aceratus]
MTNQRGVVRGHSLPADQCQLHPDYLLLWWQLYAKSVLPLLQHAYGDSPFTSGFVEGSEEIRSTSPGAPGTSTPPKLSSNERKQRWEAGQIDYMGDDSFVNIERKLDSF